MNRGTQTSSNQRVAANVRRLLNEQGVTRESFARHMKWSETTYWRRVNKAQRWYLDEVDDAARVLGTTPDALNSEVTA